MLRSRDGRWPFCGNRCGLSKLKLYPNLPRTSDYTKPRPSLQTFSPLFALFGIGVGQFPFRPLHRVAISRSRSKTVQKCLDVSIIRSFGEISTNPRYRKSAAHYHPVIDLQIGPRVRITESIDQFFLLSESQSDVT